jgi:hypothetical protein
MAIKHYIKPIGEFVGDYHLLGEDLHAGPTEVLEIKRKGPISVSTGLLNAEGKLIYRVVPGDDPQGPIGFVHHHQPPPPTTKENL